MKNLDDVLKKSLTPAESEEGPDFWLNPVSYTHLTLPTIA